MSTVQILIADDERAIREGIRRTLQRKWPEWDIVIAASAEEAIAVMEDSRMDIVLTDILMPGLSGLEFMKMMKRQHPGVKWVVISAHSEFSYAQQAVRLGASDYMLKPIGKARLYELIGSLEQEIQSERESRLDGAHLKASLTYLREGIFQRLALGLDVGNLDLSTFSREYPEFYLFLTSIKAEEQSARLEHFIVRNVISELTEGYGKGCIISYDRKSLLGLVFIQRKGGPESFQRDVRSHLTHYLKAPFQFAASGLTRDIGEIPALVSQLRLACAATDSEPEPLKGSGERAIEVALEYIRGHYCEELSLEKIAATVYLNPAYFSQLFKQKTGLGYKEYVTSLRLERAKVLLLNPKLRLAEIAEHVGYQDVRHFTQVFRKRYQLTPTEYRHQQEVNNIF